MSRPTQDLTNKKFGKLTAICKDNFVKKTKWICKCDCGKSKSIAAQHLIANKTKSCGCNYDKYSNRINASLHRYFTEYKVNAKSRKYNFNLLFLDFKTIIFNNCYYCNSPPNRIFTTKTKRQESIKVNGIDRLDNGQYYSIDNCVACCSDCNYAKQSKTKDEFLELVNKIYKNRIEK